MPRKKRSKRNISGLRNQGPRPEEPSMPADTRSASPEKPSDLELDGDEWNQADQSLYGREIDPDLSKEQREELIDEEDGEGYEMDLDQDLDDEVFCDEMLELARNCGDDPDDEDWVPADVRKQRVRRARERKARPKHYATGPVIANKAERTQRRYKENRKGQTELTSYFGFQDRVVPQRRERSTSPSPSTTATAKRCCTQSISSPEPELTAPPCEQLTPPPAADYAGADDSNSSCTASWSSPDSGTQPSEPPLEPDIPEEWEVEAEAVNLIPGTVPTIRPWGELRDHIKAELKNKSKTLPLSKVNQLMILRNFASLRLKGHGIIDASMLIARQWHDSEGLHFARKVRALARHYQLFERLPVERRGGERKSRSLLLDENLKTAARGWLMNQKVGTVTPQKFGRALNEEILPSLNITLAKALCERTARRWLVKLGFRRTVATANSQGWVV
ncbi:hypothetical protein B0H11DRAFT_486251 [Mycena galericulata]|nr:hypothetical protein B0H11DRAFT_486251 [Mycena galericulata]